MTVVDITAALTEGKVGQLPCDHLLNELRKRVIDCPPEHLIKALEIGRGISRETIIEAIIKRNIEVPVSGEIFDPIPNVIRERIKLRKGGDEL